MFKKFGKEDISGFTQVKASVARGIRCEQQQCCWTRCSWRRRRRCLTLPPAPAASIGEQYPFLADNGVLDVLLPKKEPLFVAKT